MSGQLDQILDNIQSHMCAWHAAQMLRVVMVDGEPARLDCRVCDSLFRQLEDAR